MKLVYLLLGSLFSLLDYKSKNKINKKNKDISSRGEKVVGEPKNNKISELVRNKVIVNGGKVVISLLSGAPCVICDNGNNCFVSDKLPQQEIGYCVFDIIYDLLKRKGGKAKKGDGRSFKVGNEKCSKHTVIGALAYEYYNKQDGDSTFDPVFVLAAVLEWANISKNCRGYIELI